MASNNHTEVPGGKPPFPPFQGETFPSQIFWLVICFVALYVLLSRVALPRLGKAIEHRKGRIESDLDAANRARNESEAAQAAYEKALADARAKAQALASETNAKLAAESEEQRKSLEAGLKSKLDAAEKQVATTKSAAMANVRTIAVDTAGLIVERLTGKAPAQPAVERAVDAALH
ncbi:MAG: F0F1 ATP synthase subunit B' [Xanthobacteraceae bacterium]|mgnify:CR=1 FL=1|nr:F0F1 ATP synthase subunit B' [Xanthobacteraceae bacterium]QYK45514.1 MAG: F0F1 ATP synthase subunit B' [Xanthobacteraceae bacterium]